MESVHNLLIDWLNTFDDDLEIEGFEDLQTGVAFMLIVEKLFPDYPKFEDKEPALIYCFLALLTKLK